MPAEQGYARFPFRNGPGLETEVGMADEDFCQACSKLILPGAPTAFQNGAMLHLTCASRVTQRDATEATRRAREALATAKTRFAEAVRSRRRRRAKRAAGS